MCFLFKHVHTWHLKSIKGRHSFGAFSVSVRRWRSLNSDDVCVGCGIQTCCKVKLCNHMITLLYIIRFRREKTPHAECRCCWTRYMKWKHEHRYLVTYYNTYLWKSTSFSWCIFYFIYKFVKCRPLQFSMLLSLFSRIICYTWTLVWQRRIIIREETEGVLYTWIGGLHQFNTHHRRRHLPNGW